MPTHKIFPNSALNLPASFEPEPPIRTAHHAITLLPDTGPMLLSVFRDIDRAVRRALVECYIVMDDKLGRALGDALLRAVAHGVPARLLFDALGSHLADSAFFDSLREQGVGVRSYRPGDDILDKGGAAPRDHSRVIVADDAAYTGGAAWSDPWLPKEVGGEGWHDVCVRIEGPCVEDFVKVFEQRWMEANSEMPVPVDIDTEDAYPDVRLVADTPKHDSLVYLQHREAIQRAKERIWIENAYFFPSPPLLRDLYDAAARGVDVRIILPGASDLPIIDRAAKSEYAAWIDHGMKLFAYMPRVLHSKVAVIDDDWCTIGTFNANATSLALANEVNLFVFDKSFVRRVADHFEHDLKECDLITREDAERRGVIDKIGDALASNAMTLVDAVLGPRES